MNTENLNIAGKNAGEIARDFADFLSQACVVQGRQEMDIVLLETADILLKNFHLHLCRFRLKKSGVRTCKVYHCVM